MGNKGCYVIKFISTVNSLQILYIIICTNTRNKRTESPEKLVCGIRNYTVPFFVSYPTEIIQASFHHSMDHVF